MLHLWAEFAKIGLIMVSELVTGYRTANSRWSRLGPYYAMFPMEFAIETINKFSNENDYVLDPFTGRGSSIYASGILNRNAYGIEINPVGWLYGKVKLNPANKDDVIQRLKYIYSIRNFYKKSSKKMPVFFHICFSDEVRNFLLAARKKLDWKNNNIDATLMAIILDNLHGNIGNSLSNQMKKTKAMGENYSINWWKLHKLEIPPQINPLELLLKKIHWRYEKGTPKIDCSVDITLGESTKELETVSTMQKNKFSLLFTSPPYYSITNYHADQWLRLWVLGGSDTREKQMSKNQGGFTDKQHYYNLLNQVFYSSSLLMKENSTVYVRTDVREFTFNSTLSTLKEHFPNHSLDIYKKPLKNGKNQTSIFKNKAKSSGEVDIVLRK